MEPLPLITSLQLIICFLYNLREASFESRNYKVPLYSLQENKEIPPPPNLEEIKETVRQGGEWLAQLRKDGKRQVFGRTERVNLQ